MKKYIKIVTLSLGVLLSTNSCEDYLNIPPEAAISEEEIFGTYAAFQGFQDKLLNNLVDYNNHGARVTHSIGGEAISPNGQSVFGGNNGDYWYLLSNRGIYCPAESNLFASGLYSSMWDNIRIANMCLEKLESGLLTEATQDQRDWLKGQALFFRAYYYYEFVRSFGTVPYIDKVLSAEEQNMKRHWTYEKNGKTYTDVQAVFERIVDDLDEAATLLPAVWPSPNINWGRPNKVAALGFKAKALQFSASPLFNEQATGILDYNVELLNRCALACKEVIDLAVSLVGTQPAGMPAVASEGLTPWASMRKVFTTVDGTQPYTQEVLFHRTVNRFGPPMVSESSARNHNHFQIGNQRAAQGSQNYLDKFEMKDGSRYQIAYDLLPARRWVDRDNRFKFNFYVHGDPVFNIVCNFSTAQSASDGAMNSNAIRKYLSDNIMKTNPGLSTYSTPLLRLADIYLTYAEAVFESTGSYSTIPAGLTMTAEDAVNIVRLRAGQPNVAATLPFYENNPLPNCEELASDPAFRLLYRNERAVELAYEGVYWFDLRRWKRAHLKDGVKLQALRFNVTGSGTNVLRPIVESSVVRADVATYVFKSQHYWMPFAPSLTRFTADWEQNPGW
jgi:hypothetical protein